MTLLSLYLYISSTFVMYFLPMLILAICLMMFRKSSRIESVLSWVSITLWSIISICSVLVFVYIKFVFVLGPHGPREDGISFAFGMISQIKDVLYIPASIAAVLMMYNIRKSVVGKMA